MGSVDGEGSCDFKIVEFASKKVMASHGLLQQEELDLLRKVVIAQRSQISALCEQVLSQETQISVLCKELAFLRLGFKRSHDLGDIPTSHFDGILHAVVFVYVNIEGATRRESYKRAVHRWVLAAKSRVLKAQLENQVITDDFSLSLPNLQFRKFRDKSVKDSDVYNTFVDYLYLGTISGSRLIFMWKDLLLLATEFEIATLREDCEQFLENSIPINGSNILEILEVGLTCTSEAVLRCAIKKSFEDPKAHLVQFNDARYKKLVETFPDLHARVTQGERAARIRQGTKLIDYSQGFTEDTD